VTITLNNGKSFQETILFPKGDPQDPLTSAEIETKFRENVRGALTSPQAAKLLRAIYALPNAGDIDDVAALLRFKTKEREVAHV
jgi:2-methylcitrate dehydratase PrpD